MATSTEILQFLCPNSEWLMIGDDFDNIKWIKGEPISREQFEAGFTQYNSWKAQAEAGAAAKKAAAEAKLLALGLTADDLKALGLG